MIMKNQTCCFTGHRNIPIDERESIKQRLKEEIISLIHQGVRYFATGGALGFDTMAALAVLKLKREYPHIRLILVLPYRDQQEKWRAWDKFIYDLILDQADKAVYISRYYTHDCMHKRNRHLVDHSGICVCYLTNPHSGTAYTVDYAKQRGLRIINLAPQSR